jgi:O6-methylguanine-DNA--protein-cysteine methyltransferase
MTNLSLYPIIVPCHRVLAARGKPNGFTTKLRLLKIAGAQTWTPI